MLQATDWESQAGWWAEEKEYFVNFFLLLGFLSIFDTWLRLAGSSFSPLLPSTRGLWYVNHRGLLEIVIELTLKSQTFWLKKSTTKEVLTTDCHLQVPSFSPKTFSPGSLEPVTFVYIVSWDASKTAQNCASNTVHQNLVVCPWVSDTVL